ncbi:MAG: cation diffusion facilitator family transporter [Candidatus Helarchaeota archaeon]
MRDQTKLAISSMVTASIFLLELISGLLFNSLSLISDSFHVLIDITALLISLIAIKMATKEGCGDNYTYGYHRLEILAAIINAEILGVAVYIIFKEAINRFILQESIEAIPTLIAATIGISANIISIFILRTPHSHHEDINIKSAFYHVIGDTLASVGVIVGTTIIFYTNFYWIDPIIALIIAGILIISIIRIFIKSLRILMQASEIDISRLKKIFLDNDTIVGVHDLHFWHLCSNISILTAHICTNKENINDFSAIIADLKKKIDQEFPNQNIYLTLQFEKPENHCSCTLTHKSNDNVCKLHDH